MANEKRPIDANVLKDKLQAHHDFFVDAWGGFSNLPVKDKARVDEITNCIAEVTNAPTLDAVPVVHGRWEDDHGDYVCSCCHTVFTDELVWIVRGESNEPNYCPHCGAKMDGGNEDG